MHCGNLDSVKKNLLKEITEGNFLRMEICLWQAVIAYQGNTFKTAQGLSFTYTVKQNKYGNPSGELLISRKEESKTLTKSSVMMSFKHVIANANIQETENGRIFTPAFYKGPKSIGQIFGISYIYSNFSQIRAYYRT